MPTIHGLPAGHLLEAAPEETLLDAARRADVPLASSCAGRGICGDCVLRVVDGVAALTPADVAEEAWRKRTGRGGPHERLACRVRAVADAIVSTTYW